MILAFQMTFRTGDFKVDFAGDFEGYFKRSSRWSLIGDLDGVLKGDF